MQDANGANPARNGHNGKHSIYGYGLQVRCVREVERFEAAQKTGKGMKIVLLQTPIVGFRPTGRTEINLLKSLPFFKSSSGQYTHRVRSARMYFDYGELSHTSIKLWCGMSGFAGDKGKLLEVPSEQAIMCGTCEGRAIGAGQTESRVIAGRMLKYSPKI